MSNYTVRLGKPNSKDRELFIILWREFLTEHHSLGGDLPPSEDNLLEFLRIYDSYTAGSLFGIALLSFEDETPVGVFMAGEEPPSFRLRFEEPGRLGWIYGTYIQPGYRREGRAATMQELGRAECSRLGFTRMRSYLVEGYNIAELNALGSGCRKVASVIEHDLEPPVAKTQRTRKDGEL